MKTHRWDPEIEWAREMAALEQPVTPTLEERLRKKADEAIGELDSIVSAEAMAKSVIDALAAKRDQMIWELLGLRDKWGKFEVDHCNQRMTTVDNYLKEAVGDIVLPWIQQQVATVLHENTQKTIVKAVQAEAVDHFQRKYRSHLRAAADAEIARLAEEDGKRLGAAIFAEQLAKFGPEDSTEGENA